MDSITLYAPIAKTDDEQRMVYGYASTEALDSQGEIVKREALSEALSDYMKWANVREMHQPKVAGKTKKAQIDDKGLYVGVKVIADDAWKMVKEGGYNGFSIGGKVKMQKGNEITGLVLSEISLVDRPANPEAKFDVWKMDLGESKFEEVEKSDVVEDKKEEVVEEPKEDVAETPKEEKAEEVKEVVVEEKVDEKVDAETSLQKIEDLIKEEKMPTDDEIKNYLEVQGLPMDTQAISRIRWELAGKVMEKVAERVNKAHEAGKAETEEKVEEVKPEVVEEPKVEEIVEDKKEEVAEEKVEEKSEAIEDIAKVGRAISAANGEKITAAIKSLQEQINSLREMMEGDMTEQEESIEGDEQVHVAGSTGWTGTHMEGDEKEEKADKPLDIAKAEDNKASQELSKVEAELELLKGEVKKLSEMPLPVKARASFVTVEKFDNPETAKSEELSKAESRAVELQELLKSPATAEAYKKEAAELATKIMRLRRENAGN